MKPGNGKNIQDYGEIKIPFYSNNHGLIFPKYYPGQNGQNEVQTISRIP